MHDLTRNYVSQIDRMFTLAEMLAATGQTEQEARASWEQLLKEGHLIEVKGASVPFYRYKFLRKSAKQRSRERYQRNREERNKRIIAYLKANPGARSREMRKALRLSKDQVLAALKRLIKANRVERSRCHYYNIVEASPMQTPRERPNIDTVVLKLSSDALSAVRHLEGK